MSENELEEILNDIKTRSNTNSFSGDAPMSESDNNINMNDIPPTNLFSVEKEADSFDLFEFSNDHSDREREREREKKRKSQKKEKSKKTAIIAVVAVVIIALIVGVAFALTHKDSTEEVKKEDVPVKTEESIDLILNPLTGESGFNKAALSTRPVAVVVENEYSTEAVRPQWALSDADIVLEGESEFSTRLLLFWADYTSVPEMVGPTRSARPPFIRFSQLFDCIFIHAGLSSSKGNYVGADSVFVSDDVDHINLLNCTEDGTYFGRNNERYTAVEHTGYLNGKNLPELIKEKEISTELNSAKFTSLNFAKEPAPLSESTATYCEFKWSSTGISACPKVGKFTYNSTSHKYTTTDFDSSYGESGVAFENLIFLFDETEYIVKENYKNSGNSEIYCDYRLSGGKGTVLSEGTAVDITWGVSDGKLWLKATDGAEVTLNPGKSYIGYGSSNHGGSLMINQPDSTNEYE